MGSRVFFNPLQGIWMPDGILFQVFDKASRTDHKMHVKQTKKSLKSTCMQTKTWYPN